MSPACLPDKKLLILDNGASVSASPDRRLHEMQLGTSLRFGQAIDRARRGRPRRNPTCRVAMIHRTSVGILTPVVSRRDLPPPTPPPRRRRASLGAEDIDVVRDHIDVLWGSANKCLHGAAGVSFVTCSPRTWAHIASVKPRVYYLDLQRYRKVMQEKSQTPFTPAVGTLYALEAAALILRRRRGQPVATLTSEPPMRRGLASSASAPSRATARATARSTPRASER